MRKKEKTSGTLEIAINCVILSAHFWIQFKFSESDWYVRARTSPSKRAIASKRKYFGISLQFFHYCVLSCIIPKWETSERKKRSWWVKWVSERGQREWGEIIRCYSSDCIWDGCLKISTWEQHTQKKVSFLLLALHAFFLPLSVITHQFCAKK